MDVHILFQEARKLLTSSEIPYSFVKDFTPFVQTWRKPVIIAIYKMQSPRTYPVKIVSMAFGFGSRKISMVLFRLQESAQEYIMA